MSQLQEQYLVHFNNFISQLKVIFQSETDNYINQILSNIESLDDSAKLSNGLSFISSINDENFDLFVKSKIKVFSHKNDDTLLISESLFGPQFCLKNLLNNQEDEVKKIIWENLHNLYLIRELLKSPDNKNNARIDILNKLLYKEEKKEAKPTLQAMLGVDVNDHTTDMIEEIVTSFESLLTKNSTGNPLAGIMEISQLISVKYADKINNGEIELDKLMKSITSKVPGMDKMMSGMMGANGSTGMGGMGGMGDMMSSMMGMGGGGQTKKKEKILIDETFSTANVEVGINKEPEKNFNISSVLKMADQFGVLPPGKEQESESQTNIPGFEGMPHIGKVMEMMQKLNKTESKEEAQSLKTEMDTFLQSELGIDVNLLNEQLETVTKQMNTPK